MKVKQLILLAAVCLSACGGSSPSSPSTATAPAVASPSHRFEAISAGYLQTTPANGLAEFRVDSTSIFSRAGGSLNTARGFSLAVYNNATGQLVQAVQSFETFEDPTGANARAFVSALNAVPNGMVMMIAVADESGLTEIESCTHKDMSPIEAALRGLGSTLIGGYCYRNAWSMIVVKGEGKKDEQLSTTAQVTSRYTS